jgi:hypothetical protein
MEITNLDPQKFRLNLEQTERLKKVNIDEDTGKADEGKVRSKVRKKFQSNLSAMITKSKPMSANKKHLVGRFQRWQQGSMYYKSFIARLRMIKRPR